MAYKSHYQYLKRLPLQFQRVATPEVQPVPRNPEHDGMMFALDGVSIRCKDIMKGAKPKLFSLDAWTSQLYEHALAGDSNALSSPDAVSGQTAHYMQMKLAGAVFQHELTAPKPLPSRRQHTKAEHEERAQIADKWLRTSVL